MCVKFFPLNWENANNSVINICVTLGSFLSYWRLLDKNLFCFCLFSLFSSIVSRVPKNLFLIFLFLSPCLSDQMISIKCLQTYCFFPLCPLVYDRVHTLYFRNTFVAHFSSQVSVFLQHCDETFIFCHLFNMNRSLAECLGDSHCILRRLERLCCLRVYYLPSFSCTYFCFMLQE